MSLSFDHHISKKFNQELEAVRSDLMRMGGIVELQLQNAVDSLIKADSQLAETVVKTDNRVNDLEVKIDEECTQIIARRQPTASDLRFIIAVSKTVGDIERIGDHGVKVAKKAIELIGASEQPKGYVEIRHISEKVIVMFNKALDAFARLDADSALEVIKADEQVNLEYSSAIRVMITSMMEDPRNIGRSLEVIWALRSLERVGDHSINIAEQVIYLVKGKDMRHKTVEQIEKIMAD
jgi:phosphate transport system protein